MNETPSVCKIIPFQMEILSRHREYLSRWVEAGLPMGVCDADVFSASQRQPGLSSEYVVIWVRETPDPAYKVFPGETDGLLSMPFVSINSDNSVLLQTLSTWCARFFPVRKKL